MRRALTHDHAPTLATALAAVGYLLWTPPTADMAGHTYRAWLFSHEGLTVWNAQWYDGHHVLGYSLAFAPLSVWPGPAWTGALAAVATVALLMPLLRRAAPGRPVAAAVAGWLFALAVVSNLVIGRMPFLLGLALAVGAWAAVERARTAPRAAGGSPARDVRSSAWSAAAAACALLSVLASPVAGAFLVLGAVARLLGGRRAALVPAALLALPVLAGGGALALLFPEGGDDRFVASAFWPMLGVCVAALVLLAPARRAWWAAGALAIAMLAASFVVPNTFGQNALRLPVLLGPVALVVAPRRTGLGARRLPRALVVAGLVYLAWLPAVRAVAETHDDPSTQSAFWTDARAFLHRVAQPGERVEVAFTHNHWEAAYLATAVPLARGWERQLDEKVNPIFYDDHRMTPARYHAWLRHKAVHWVALPDAPLDYSARGEARIIRSDPSYLRLAASPPGWRIYQVRDAEPPASDGARILAAGPDGFDVRADGPTVVREHYTRYWHSDGACVTRAPGGWTRVDPDRPGRVKVRARFRIGGRAGDACGATLTSAGRP